MKKVVLLFSILLVAVFIFGCASTPSPAQPATSAPTTSAPPKTTSAAPASPAASAEPLKIGSIFSLTGESSMDSPFIKAALEYRLEQVGYQVAGRKIQLTIEDDGTDPTNGVDKARKLLQQDKVDVIVGPLNGAVAAAVANFVNSSKIPQLIFMPSPATLLTLPGGDIYLPYGTLQGGGYYLGQYAHDKLGYKSATVIYEDFISGQQIADGTVKGFQSKDGTIVQTTAVKMGTQDFSPYLSVLKSADCVIFWFTPATNQRFVTQYYASGLNMPLILPVANVLLPPVLKTIGDKAIGIVGAQQYTSLISTDLNKAWVADFNAKKGMVPSASASCADLTLTLYLEAVKATGGDTSFDKINSALHKVKVTTPAGTFSFAPNGLGIGDLYITKVLKTPEGVLNWGVQDTVSQVPFDMPR
jgi:branched-chain amino acid transport system substrate-binding protein